VRIGTHTSKNKTDIEEQTGEVNKTGKPVTTQKPKKRPQHTHPRNHTLPRKTTRPEIRESLKPGTITLAGKLPFPPADGRRSHSCKLWTESWGEREV